MRDIKQVLVVRKDLHMRMGKVAAQCCHASLGLILDAQRRNQVTEAMQLWMDPDIGQGFKKVVVYVNSEDELLALVHIAFVDKIPCKVITDSGTTEFNGVPTITCMAIGPDWSDKIDKITGELPLL